MTRPIVLFVRGLPLIAVILWLSACSSDPCVTAPNSPACEAQQAVTRATVVAVNADSAARERQAAMKATQDAIALQAQATQGAINSQATAEAVAMSATAGARRVEAEATQMAVQNKATVQAVEAAATQNAISLKATAQSIQASATQTALEGETRVRIAEADASSASARHWLLIGTCMMVLVTVGLSFAWYSRQTMRAVQHGVMMKAAFRTYGPNNSRAVLLMPGPRGQVHATAIDDLIGDHILSDGTQSILQLLDVSDQEKLRAYVEQAKRRKAVELSYAVGAWPEIDESEPPQQLAAPTTGYPYVITTMSPTVPPLATWLDEVDGRLLASPS